MQEEPCSLKTRTAKLMSIYSLGTQCIRTGEKVIRD